MHSFGSLMKMWKMMYKCHRVQNNISLNLNHLSDYQGFDFSTEFHYHATAQLETEVASWHQSFCKLIHAQQEYVRTLCRWIKLTDCLVSDHERSGCSSAVRQLGEEWLLQFERLPDKVLIAFAVLFICSRMLVFLNYTRNSFIDMLSTLLLSPKKKLLHFSVQEC